MVELKRPLRSERSRLHLQAVIKQSEVGLRRAATVAGFKAMQREKPANELFADLAAVRVSEHPVADQRRPAPDVLWRVFADDLDQKVDWCQVGGSHCRRLSSLF